MSAGSMAMDETFYSSPKEFLPELFHSGSEVKGNLVHWGSGRFTCPGRWYASAMMKVIIALMITKYDVKFPEGQVERLPNVYMDILVEPNPKQMVQIRIRENEPR
jgi:cytochrome P450